MIQLNIKKRVLIKFFSKHAFSICSFIKVIKVI